MHSFDIGSTEPTLYAVSNFDGARSARNECARDSERYALVKSGPDVLPEEVESADALAVEVMVLWGSNVLHVVHLSPPRSFYIGDSNDGVPSCDYWVPVELLGGDRLPLLLGEQNCPRLVIWSGATGHVELPGEPQLSLDQARQRATRSEELPGAYELALSRGARARLELQELVFQVAIVNAGRKVKKGAFATADWHALGYFGASFMAAGAMMAALALFVPNLNTLDEETLDRERLYLINAYLEAQAERERDKQETVEQSDSRADSGGTGERATGEEGAMGSPTSRATGKRYAIRGIPDNPDPHLARVTGREEAVTFGMIAVLTGSDPEAPTAPWGRDTSLGLDASSHRGSMWGDEIGESYGAAGLGLSSIGEGGGGPGFGIGLGNIGQLGHGAGLGLRDGFGNGVGRSSGTRTPKPPFTMRPGQTLVSGRLPPEVIQRIVRQNYGRFRMCYEQGLLKNPNLSGRVSVRFAISRDGAVQTAQNGGSDLPDSAVVGCVVSAFYGLTFPEPDNGIVTVSYPIMFSPG